MQTPQEIFDASRSLCGAGFGFAFAVVGVDVPLGQRDRLAVEVTRPRDRVEQPVGEVRLRGELVLRLALLAGDREVVERVGADLALDELAHVLDELGAGSILDHDPSLGEELVAVLSGVEGEHVHAVIGLLAERRNRFICSEIRPGSRVRVIAMISESPEAIATLLGGH